MEKQKTVQEVIQELREQVSIALSNNQPGVVKQLEQKIARIEKRAKKGVK